MDLFNVALAWLRRFRWAALFAVALGVSLLLWHLSAERRERRVYPFPNRYKPGIGVEERLLPPRPDRREEIELYVKEYLLGPAQNRLYGILPLGTRLKSLFLADGVVYLDLDHRSVRADLESRIGLKGALELLAQGLKRNFPEIQDVVITIEGRQPGFPSEDGP